MPMSEDMSLRHWLAEQKRKEEDKEHIAMILLRGKKPPKEG